VIGISELISFEEFKEVNLRIGKVEEVKGNTVIVDIGFAKVECKKGNAEVQANDSVVVVLKENKGMLLAADVEGAPVLLQPDKEVPAGTKVR